VPPVPVASPPAAMLPCWADKDIARIRQRHVIGMCRCFRITDVLVIDNKGQIYKFFSGRKVQHENAQNLRNL
jgi:hypothetical protein